MIYALGDEQRPNTSIDKNFVFHITPPHESHIPGSYTREIVHGSLPFLFTRLCPGYMVLDWDDRTAVLADFRTCREIASIDRIPGIAVVSLAMVTGDFPLSRIQVYCEQSEHREERIG